VALSSWPGKYVIGLTGNIGTGKSVVRRMLEHLGAYSIDADGLAHRVMAKSAPGYQKIIATFGKWVLGPDGEIDRAKMGRLVFSDPEALRQLEAIVHPFVLQGVDYLIKHSTQRVIVVEAIKLLEANMHKSCDSVWVVYASPNTQLTRLLRNRKMNEAEAQKRITSQAPQQQKIAAANVVIRNEGSFEDTWKQVLAAFQKIGLASEEPAPVKAQPAGGISVMRGKPRDSQSIAALMNRLRPTALAYTREDVMAAFGEKAFLLLKIGENLGGLLGWQVENLVSRTIDILLLPDVPANQALPPMMEEIEQASRNLQCEASLVFVPNELANESLWKAMGYEKRAPESLSVSAWQEAARESTMPNTQLFFKQLRQDRILRPI
jgi:dephospho-CoA kinase